MCRDIVVGSAESGATGWSRLVSSGLCEEDGLLLGFWVAGDQKLLGKSTGSKCSIGSASVAD